MKKISIMIVDDHTLIRETWGFFLGMNENFDVIAETGDGAFAIETARRKRPDIILLDINMAPLNGFELLKIIRKVSPVSKVIIVSVHSEPAFVKKMLRSGARGYITKNSPSDELVLAINEVNQGKLFIGQNVGNILSVQTKKDSEIPSFNSLSERELQIVRLLNEGNSSKEIAAHLNISLNTVEAHRHNLLKKMKMRNTVALIRYINSNAVEL